MPMTFEALQILVTFLVPGYIVDTIIDRTIARQARQAHSYVLSILSWGGINYTLWYVVWTWFLSVRLQPAAVSIFLLLMVFVSPVLLGFAAAYVYSRDLTGRVQEKLKISRVDPIPRAWDMVFGRRESAFVLVTLKDGSQIGGYYGPLSAASSYPAPEDIYLELRFELKENGEFKEPIKNSKGVLIRGEEIRCIEFCEIKTKEKKEAGDPSVQEAA